MEDGWDGIKPGFFGSQQARLARGGGGSGSLGSRGNRTRSLLEGEPAQSNCC